MSNETTNSRIVRVRDLPIYYDTKIGEGLNENQAKTVNSPSWLYVAVSDTRKSVQRMWNDNKTLRERIVRGVETGDAHTRATIDYIRDDETLLPKVGVVTIAGLGGLLLGHKGGPVRKGFYSSVAALVALSACYPKQSANLLDQVYLRIKTETNSLLNRETNSPSSTTIKTTLVESKDRILHTTKNSNEPIVTVKGDYGQGTPADQHLYTTRGVNPPSVLEAEKKL